MKTLAKHFGLAVEP